MIRFHPPKNSATVWVLFVENRESTLSSCLVGWYVLLFWFGLSCMWALSSGKIQIRMEFRDNAILGIRVSRKQRWERVFSVLQHGEKQLFTLEMVTKAAVGRKNGCEKSSKQKRILLCETKKLLVAVKKCI